MTPEELIAKARDLAEKATPGPWAFGDDERLFSQPLADEAKAMAEGHPYSNGEPRKIWEAKHKVMADSIVLSGYDDGSCNGSDVDREFIAESRALVPQLADALEATQRELHKAIRKGDEIYARECEAFHKLDTALVLIRQSMDELDDAMRDVDPSVSWAPIRSRFNAFLARMGGGT